MNLDLDLNPKSIRVKKLPELSVELQYTLYKAKNKHKIQC